MYLFANYVWDSEISQYHCYRRQYDPVLARFSSRPYIIGIESNTISACHTLNAPCLGSPSDT